MADAVSRMTSGDRIGVFTMQHGPGAENSFGGVAQAYGDSSPIVVLPGGYPRNVAGVPPHFSSALNYRHVTKSAETLSSADQISASLRRAFTNVRNGRPRPALLELPVDLLDAEVDDPIDYVPTSVTEVRLIRLRSGRWRKRWWTRSIWFCMQDRECTTPEPGRS